MIFGNLLRAGEHVSIYEPPKTGKMSLVHQTLYNLRNDGMQFTVAFVDMLNVRTLSDFLIKFGTAVMKSAASTPDDYATIVRDYLAGTHFVFDRVRFMTYEELVSLNWNPDMNDVEKMLELPQRIAQEKHSFLEFILLQIHIQSDVPLHTINHHKAVKTARTCQGPVSIGKGHFHDMKVVIHADRRSISENFLELIESNITQWTFHIIFYQKNIND